MIGHPAFPLWTPGADSVHPLAPPGKLRHGMRKDPAGGPLNPGGDFPPNASQGVWSNARRTTITLPPLKAPASIWSDHIIPPHAREPPMSDEPQNPRPGDPIREGGREGTFESEDATLPRAKLSLVARQESGEGFPAAPAGFPGPRLQAGTLVSVLRLGTLLVAVLGLGALHHFRPTQEALAQGSGDPLSGDPLECPSECPSEGVVVHGDDGRPEEQEQPRVIAVSAGLDGGTVLVRVLKQAMRMPAKAIPGQLPGPCPKGLDEFKGSCWGKVQWTVAQVKEGVCETYGLYEPSAGGCRAHLTGFHPHPGQFNDNNTAEGHGVEESH